MTQRNIDIMDKIVDEMLNGKKLSEALRMVYSKRNIAIPYNEELFDVELLTLNISKRAAHCPMRKGLMKIKDVINFAAKDSLKNIPNLGAVSGQELLEGILDFAWDNMNKSERAEFLIDTVERNEKYIRAELM